MFLKILILVDIKKKLADSHLLRMVCVLLFSSVVLNLFGIRDQFQERQSSHRWWQGWGMTQAHDISYATTDLTGGRAQVVM